MSMIKTFEAITAYDRANNTHPIKGFRFSLLEDCRNDYHHDQLPVIPAGTKLVADFAGDFGIYGMVEVEGVLHKVKIGLHELHKINFGPFDAR